MRIHGTGTMALLCALAFAAAAGCNSGGRGQRNAGSERGQRRRRALGAAERAPAPAGAGGWQRRSGRRRRRPGMRPAAQALGAAPAAGRRSRGYLTRGDPVCSGHRPATGVKPLHRRERGGAVRRAGRDMRSRERLQRSAALHERGSRQRGRRAAPRSAPGGQKHDIRYRRRPSCARVRRGRRHAARDLALATTRAGTAASVSGVHHRRRNPASPAAASDGLIHVDRPVRGTRAMAVGSGSGWQHEADRRPRAAVARRSWWQLDSGAQARRARPPPSTRAAGRAHDRNTIREQPQGEHRAPAVTSSSRRAAGAPRRSAPPTGHARARAIGSKALGAG